MMVSVNMEEAAHTQTPTAHAWLDGLEISAKRVCTSKHFAMILYPTAVDHYLVVAVSVPAAFVAVCGLITVTMICAIKRKTRRKKQENKISWYTDDLNWRDLVIDDICVSSIGMSELARTIAYEVALIGIKGTLNAAYGVTEKAKDR